MNADEIPPDGTVVAEAPERGQLREVLRLTNIETDVQSYPTGTASYKAGAVYTCDTDSITQLLQVMPLTMWIVCDGVFLRIQTVSSNHWREKHRIECTQGTDTGCAVIYGKGHTLRLVEPSPPRPTDEWLDAERSRAIRDLLGDARPAVLVPGDGGLVPCDPWAVSE